MHPTSHTQARILVVDDQRDNVEMLQRILRQYEVHTASNGRAALAKLEQEHYDLVMLDIMMPELGGIETLQHIRQHYSDIELPVMLVSALSERKSMANGRQMGANDYIVKPFDVEDVLARVNTQLRLKRFADERQQMIAGFQQMVEWQERLMQVASHDLRNPLNNLRMLVSLMKKSFAEDQATMRMLQMMDSSIQTMNNIIDEFLDVRITDTVGNMRVELTETNTFNLITQIVNQYAVAAFNKDIRLHANNIGGIVLADPNRLSQVIANLVSNAIKYSPRHGDVWIETLVQDGIWQLTVTDSGPGVPENERHLLFQPFSKISNKPTAGEASTGLGLWIVREMVHAQNGEVGVHFPPEGGSQFWVQLPALAQDDAGRRTVGV
ncbi:MAG: hybrid sensor histidine kinase/response regulator [Anaerolineae bacterium]